MKKHETKKGFTLIELLIVIAIIAILAVAFLPTLLGAPAKGRDTARIADLQKVQKILVNANLEKGKYPGTSGIITDALISKVYSNASTWTDDFKVAFGGKLPSDPKSGWFLYYQKDVDLPAGNPIEYLFGLYAMTETTTAANSSCKATIANGVISKIELKTFGTPGTTIITDTQSFDTDACFAILTQ